MNEQERQDWLDEISRACLTLLGVSPLAVDHPGGFGRKTVIVHTSYGTHVLSRRASIERANLEALVLRGLNAEGGFAPRLVSSSERWIAQQFITGKRLSLALDALPDREALMRRSIESLLQNQQAGLRAGLAQSVGKIGTDADWLLSFARMPEFLGQLVNVPPPGLDIAALVEHLGVLTPVFIKWDSRSSNANLDDGGNIIWFDWEHCGSRSPLDDLAWFMCDDWMDIAEALEDRLVSDYLPQFARLAGHEKDEDYFRVFSVLHMCLRLALILKQKGGKPWGGRKRSLKHDKVPLALPEARRLASRASRWSTMHRLTRPLSPWLGEVHAQLEVL